MGIWVIFSLMTVAVAIVLLWPLSRPQTVAQAPDEDDVLFYRQQAAEISRDLSRGLLSSEEAEAAKAEAARRLLRSSQSNSQTLTDETTGKAALLRRRWVAILVLLIVPLSGLVLYQVHGAPDYNEQFATLQKLKQEEAQKEASRQREVQDAVEKMQTYLKTKPDDGRAWELIAPVYMGQRRFDEAANAFEKANNILGETPARLTAYAEALIYAGRGMIFDKAKTALEKAVSLDPKADKARFYLGLAAEQDSDFDKAAEYYTAAAKVGNPQIKAESEKRLANLEAAKQQAVPAVGPEAIRGMVGGLEARLEEENGTPEEWSRLVRSYTVLGQKDKAIEALAKARKALGFDKAKLAEFETAVKPLKLDNGAQ
ncbi:c-type cytochrome biogenesis protein CcmI [Microvirga sp. W0021]|uniref:C-type cytochrome biogenesis protein CcmI n=1 Tax=Hohaiivirga grylli TaxID=3133970 RepID=A0ABV0BHJ8_9HYPH